MSKVKKPKWDTFKDLEQHIAVSNFHKAMHNWALNQHWVRCVVTIKYESGKTETAKFEPASKPYVYSLIDENGYAETYAVEVPETEPLFKYYVEALGIPLMCTPTKILEYHWRYLKSISKEPFKISVECEPLKY